MAKEARSRRPRRRFDDHFKSQAVRLVLDEGKTVGAVARDLDLTETALREWVKRAQADRTHGRTGLTTAEREELARLRKENRELRTEREIKKKALLREAPAVKFAWIAAEKASFKISELCRALHISASGYYAWGRGPESARVRRDRQLKVLVRASFTASKQSNGSPRIHRDLREDHDERVSRKRVIRLMQEEGLKARIPKRFVCTTDSDHALPVAANLLNREFTAERSSRR
jgi:transposase-like protein